MLSVFVVEGRYEPDRGHKEGLSWREGTNQAEVTRRGREVVLPQGSQKRMSNG